MKNLEDLMLLCCKFGILKYEGTLDGVPVSLTFGDSLLATAEAVPDDVDKRVEAIQTRRGKDNLTAREQIELYGRVIDAEG